ncbi:MAG: NAD kinase [Betaproteobacteria bacterium]|nr:NAD kinase [Betaproteobacteria bacterium]
MNPPFQTIALIGKYKSPEIAGPLLALAEFLRPRGLRIVVDELTAAYVAHDGIEILPLEEIGKVAQLAIVIGGDGTMLNIARALAPHDVALVGVNQGRLGFLTDVSLDTMNETIADMLDGNFVVEPRMLLAAEAFRGEDRLSQVLAFNDASVAKGADGGLIEMEVRIDGQFVYTVRADGLIIATPTGSTAYALSAGGPIVHPALSVFVLVPVCSHTLSNRPIAISSESTIEILMHRCADARVHFDSHSHLLLEEGDRIVIRRFERPIRLLHPRGHSYFHMLRQKLRWSEVL